MSTFAARDDVELHGLRRSLDRLWRLVAHQLAERARRACSAPSCSTKCASRTSGARHGTTTSCIRLSPCGACRGADPCRARRGWSRRGRDGARATVRRSTALLRPTNTLRPRRGPTAVGFFARDSATSAWNATQLFGVTEEYVSLLVAHSTSSPRSRRAPQHGVGGLFDVVDRRRAGNRTALSCAARRRSSPYSSRITPIRRVEASSRASWRRDLAFTRAGDERVRLPAGATRPRR